MEDTSPVLHTELLLMVSRYTFQNLHVTRVPTGTRRQRLETCPTPTGRAGVWKRRRCLLTRGPAALPTASTLTRWCVDRTPRVTEKAVPRGTTCD